MSDKKSILKEALTDYQEIKEAANNAAKKRLSDEFPDKFNEYLKEEINKNKDKESKKETDDQNKESKKIDEAVTKKEESKMKNNQKETQEGVEKKSNEKKETKEVVNETYTDSDVMIDDEKYDPEMEAGREEASHEIDDIMADHGLGDDEFSLDDIEKEISALDEMEAELEEARDTSFTHSDSVSYGDKDGIAFKQKLTKVKNMLDEILEKSDLDEKETISDEETPTDQDILMDSDLDEVLSELESFETSDDIEEGQGITHARRKGVDGKLPRKGQGLPVSHEKRLRYAMHEAEKKLENLINSNKKTTKSLNENRKKVKVLSELVEGYKTALEKYRDQLKSMSVFNTNLAHVNNILVNEELALTQKEKVKVIKEFKEINSITESEEKYKSLLSEMKTKKKEKIDENLDEKLSKSSTVSSSSKKALDEVVEKNAYTNNEHINRMKRISEYIENRGSKKTI